MAIILFHHMFTKYFTQPVFLTVAVVEVVSLVPCKNTCKKLSKQDFQNLYYSTMFNNFSVYKNNWKNLQSIYVRDHTTCIVIPFFCFTYIFLAEIVLIDHY